MKDNAATPPFVRAVTSAPWAGMKTMEKNKIMTMMGIINMQQKKKKEN